MKKFILLITIALCSLNSKAQEINWVSLNEALELQKKTPKKIMIDVYTKWCGPCKLLDKKTFHNEKLVDYVNKNYYAVKFNAEGNETINYLGQSFTNPDYQESNANRRNSSHQFASFMRLRGYQTISFLNEEGGFIMPLSVYQTAQQLELYLKMFATNEHKKLTSKEKFDEYYNNFKAEF